jgi:hypothetical protein
VIGGLPWWWLDMTDWYDHFNDTTALTWMPMDQAGYQMIFRDEKLGY